MRAFGLAKVFRFYLVVLAVALAALSLRGDLMLILPRGAQAWALSLLLGLASGAFVVWLSRALVARFAWAADLMREFRSMIGELERKEVLVMALASGIAEETLFRGVLQPALGYVIGSLVFGVLHMGPNKRFLPWTLMACAAGFLFGGLFLATDALLAPVLAHVTINYLNLRRIAAPVTAEELHLGPVGGEGAVGGAS